MEIVENEAAKYHIWLLISYNFLPANNVLV
jgi:hypothetical protein